MNFFLLFIHIAIAQSQTLILDSNLSSQQKTVFERTEGRKLFWWNIGCGLMNLKLIKELKEEDSLYKNIETLATSQGAPDVIVLGEHCPGRMPQKTSQLIATKYPHKFHLTKNNPYKQVNNGIIVYSKNPLSLVRSQILKTGKNEKEVKEASRTYILLKIADPKGEYFLNPLHFYNPWGKMSKSELISKAPGKDNLNYEQAELHMFELQKDVNLKDKSLIVVGDFNSAKNIFNLIDMPTYLLFASVLKDMGDNLTTYPSRT
ncbi:MAG: hypothetical protein K2Q26_10505, partial [Bdellovibrionales bacterium]|nr:hypothetical protein [Bdellovibrionales bacterium]